MKEILARLRTTYIEQINETIKNGKKINELVKESHEWFENQVKNQEDHWEPVQNENPPEIPSIIFPVSSMGIFKIKPKKSNNSFDDQLSRQEVEN